jgi:hypothetical protein
MFEDKRFKNDNDSDSNNFFMPNNTGLREGNDNLNFREQPVVYKQVKVKKDIKFNKKKLLVILLIISLLIFFIFGGFLFYKNFFNNPYRIYQNAINYGFDYLNAKVNSFNDKKLDYNINRDILSTSGSFSIDSNLLKDFKDYNFKYKLTMDLNEKMIDTNLVINNNNQKVLDIDGLLRDKKVLINSKDIYSKYLEVKEIQNLDFNNKVFDSKVLNDILDTMKSTIINNLNKNKMSTKKVKLKVQNKNISVINNIYKLNSEEVKKLYQDILDSLINNNDIINSLADTFNFRKAEIKEILNGLKTNEKILNLFKSLEFNLYTTGITNKVVGGRILFLDVEIINYTNYQDILNIKTEKENKKIDIKKDNKETKINFAIENNNLISLTVTKDGDKTNYSFNIEVDKLEVEGTFEIEVKRVANKKMSTDILLDINGKNNKDDFYLKFNFNNNTKVGGTIQNIPKNNIVNYETLSIEEKRNIENKFKDIVSKLPFKDLFKINEGLNICDIASDCECLDNICTCSYLDKYGIKQIINCER